MKRRLLVVIALASLIGTIALVLAAPGGARTVYRSVATIRTDPTFHGGVFLKEHAQQQNVRRACQADRRVRLFWQNHGDHYKKLGQAHTDQAGRWAFPTHAHHGDYFVRLVRKALPNGAVCSGAVSRKITFH
jgi:hypothetical protein